MVPDPKESSSGRLIKVRNAVGLYLDASPSKFQAGHLGDVLKMLINVDDTCTEFICSQYRSMEFFTVMINN
ncbi:MAG: hypothetical protein O7F73_07950 [Gammaproteobacteria bacterium]|nr:hypothetical protein [Gammaproteobacteria bacterium]